jgi:hypothetical protein
MKISSLFICLFTFLLLPITTFAQDATIFSPNNEKLGIDANFLLCHVDENFQKDLLKTFHFNNKRLNHLNEDLKKLYDFANPATNKNYTGIYAISLPDESDPLGAIELLNKNSQDLSWEHLYSHLEFGDNDSIVYANHLGDEWGDFFFDFKGNLKSKKTIDTHYNNSAESFRIIWNFSGDFKDRVQKEDHLNLPKMVVQQFNCVTFPATLE